MAKILVVEDDIVLGNILRDLLVRQTHTVERCVDGGEASLLLASFKYDIIVLDWQLPGVSGVELCRQIKQKSESPMVLMLTSKVAIEDKVRALDSGADDYLTKPVDIMEFTARITALLRRCGSGEMRKLTYHDLTIELDSGAVTRGDKKIDLAPKEFELLQLLTQQPQQYFSTEALITRLWGSEGSRASLANCLKRLRMRLHVDGENDLIETTPGLGYRMK